MLAPSIILASVTVYLALLIHVGWRAERRGGQVSSRGRGLRYGLSLATLCSAWTYFGGVGDASQGSWLFAANALGPILAVTLLYPVWRRIAVLSKQENVGSLADFLAFYAFLPNAPYLLTDVIHLIDDIRSIQSVWMITLVIFPVYLLVILAGFEAYVISLINLGHYLHRIGKSRWILGVELITHFLSAIGIYWGRFLRFNSWDFITQPDFLVTKGVEELLGKQPLVIIAITFVILVGLYAIMKRVSLGFVRQHYKSASFFRFIYPILAPYA